MLCNIDDDSAEEARRILTLLCFSARPLTVSELIDGTAVNLNDPVGLDRQSRLQDADSLCEICPGLISIETENNDTIYENLNKDFESKEGRGPKVRIAHFSVQEYLESDRIRQAKAASFALSRTAAHIEIAQICCAYLLEPELSEGVLSMTKLIEFPFAEFAARFWDHHYQNATDKGPRLKALILRIFKEHRESFYTWVEIYDVDKSLYEQRSGLSASIKPGWPVYYASLLGLDWVVDELIVIKGDDGGGNADLVNAKGGQYGNALQAASAGGYEKIVQILLDAGAEINTQCGRYGNALQAASHRGHEKILQMLLDVGADINTQGGYYGNAVQAASAGGHKKIVQMLLDAGAEINTQGGYYGNALQAASAGGHKKIVQMLLDAGAEINTQGGYYGNALQAASVTGHEKLFQVLLDAGADINTQCGYYGNALQAASAGGYEKIVQMLLDTGAEINTQGGPYGNALQAASAGGHKKIVQVLLDAGAEINIQDGYYGNAVQAASAGGHKKIVQILRDAGAEINT
jgi:ankyrin repeat protein